MSGKRKKPKVVQGKNGVRRSPKMYTDALVFSGVEAIWKIVAGEVKSEKDLDLYVITLAHNPVEQLDIHTWSMFGKARRHEDNPLVVGLAFGWDSAVELVARMAWDAYKKTGTCNLRDMFEE